MGKLITTAISCLCLLAYFPVIGNSLRQIQRREVRLTKWRLFKIHVTRLTGTAAILYGIAQLFSGSAIVTSALITVVEADIRFLFFGFIAGWLIGAGGAALARRVQQGESEFDVAPHIPQPFLAINEFLSSNADTKSGSSRDAGIDDIEDAEFRDIESPGDEQ